jgi:hypothetical protein
MAFALKNWGLLIANFSQNSLGLILMGVFGGAIACSSS